jgi:hypothetical protein
MMWLGVDVVVGVVSGALWVQNWTWCAVCRVRDDNMHRLCLPIATYSMCMGMGGGAGTMPVARLAWW